MPQQYRATVRAIYKSPDGINGHTAEVLERVRDDAATSPHGFPELVSAVDAYTSGAEGFSVANKLRRNGQYLFGLYIEGDLDFARPARVQLDGLVYAEASDKSDGAFSSIRMGRWISAERASKFRIGEDFGPYYDLLAAKVLVHKSRPETKGSLGPIPVSASTVVTGIRPKPDEIDFDFTVGFYKAFKDIHCLTDQMDERLPAELRSNMATLLMEHCQNIPAEVD